MFTTIYATPFLSQYYDEDYRKIQNGFQLLIRGVLGYQFEFSKKRWFLEPSLEFNYMPINTNIPDSFKEIENEYPNYSLFMPNLYFGFRF